MDYSSDSITAHVFHYFTNDKRSDANLKNTAVLVKKCVHPSEKDNKMRKRFKVFRKCALSGGKKKSSEVL